MLLMSKENGKEKEKEKLLSLIAERVKEIKAKDNGVDYTIEYRKQTGKDLETGEYVTH